jgi:hypothetical protein
MTTACGDAGKGVREVAGRVIQRDQAHDLAKARVEAEGSTPTLLPIQLPTVKPRRQAVRPPPT